MKISVAFPFDQRSLRLDLIDPDAIATVATAMEAGGIGACYVTDHPFPTRRWLDTGGHHTLDPLVALSFVAAATKRLRLHTNCFIPAYRNPHLTAKAIASLDQISQGRVILGVAAGYLEGEFEGLGIPFNDRGRRLDEHVGAMRQAWTGEDVHRDGDPGAEGPTNVVLPTPFRESGPPIWIGGNSDAAKKRAVRYGEGWVPFPAPKGLASVVRTRELTDLRSLADHIGRLRELAEHEGRTGPLDICFTPFSRPAPGQPLDVQRFLDECEALHDLGVTWLSVQFASPTLEQFLDDLATLVDGVVPKLPGSTPAS